MPYKIGLVSWRNQLTVKSHNDTVALDDARLVLVRQWLQLNSSAQTIFELWEGAGHVRTPHGAYTPIRPADHLCQRQHSLLVSLVSVLSALITLLSQNYADHALGMPIIKTLLSAQWMRRINSYLGGSHTELILVTLKLLNGLSSYAAGKERRTVLEMFSWETKVRSLTLVLSRVGALRAEIVLDPVKTLVYAT
jgi:nucleolar pre-ribosomal-associated protein 1